MARYLNVVETRALDQPITRAVALTALNVDVVLTTILAETDFSMYGTIMFVFINDGAFDFTATITTGEVTGAVDSVFAPAILVPAKVGAVPGQTTYIAGPNQLRSLYRVTGIANGGLVATRFMVKASPR